MSRSIMCRSILGFLAAAFHNVSTANCRLFHALYKRMLTKVSKMCNARSVSGSTSPDGSGACASKVHHVRETTPCGADSWKRSSSRRSISPSSSIMNMQMDATRNSNSFSTGTSTTSPLASCSAMAGSQFSPTVTRVSRPQFSFNCLSSLPSNSSIRSFMTSALERVRIMLAALPKSAAEGNEAEGNEADGKGMSPPTRPPLLLLFAPSLLPPPPTPPNLLTPILPLPSLILIPPRPSPLPPTTAAGEVVTLTIWFTNFSAI
mmetsp:Transcript_16516/g.29854  ORF Transcript_16516/g.29854 Transcript_16516/m.29854 type:complete len:262 (-) Transcript_16516:152-937(-)